MLKKNQIIQVTIEDMNHLGYGVCHIDGMAVFVRGGVSADVAEIKIIKVLKSYGVAILHRIVQPSAYRLPDPCPVHSACGGCAFAHIDYEYEKVLKGRFVEAELLKAGMNHIKVQPISTLPCCERYRNKIQLPFGPDGRLGYYAPKSHRTVCCDAGCRLHPEIFDEIAATVSDYVRQKALSIYDEKTGHGLLRHLYLRMGRQTGEIMACLVINGNKLPEEDRLCALLKNRYSQMRTFLLNINQANTNVILGQENRVLFGDGVIHDRLCGNTFEISAHSFYQVNHDMAERLYEKALELADIGPGDRVADLYCGIGTIAITAAKKVSNAEIVGVEIVPQAVENAKKNAAINQLDNVSFYCADADHPSLQNSRIILVDPPRKGLSPGLIQSIQKAAPERLVYISCAPDTLARDCRLLAEAGYRADEIYPFDMFPRTGHIECVTLLTRGQ